MMGISDALRPPWSGDTISAQRALNNPQFKGGAAPQRSVSRMSDFFNSSITT